MKRAAALGIFALGLIGLGATACMSTPYGEEDATHASEAKTKSEVLPNDVVKGDASVPKQSKSSNGGDAGGAAPITQTKTPGAGGIATNDPFSDAGSTQTDGGAGQCPKAPAAGGYISKATTPQAIGACTTGDIGFYEGLLAVKDQSYGGLETAMRGRNATCANCIFSKFEDPIWTPVVKLSATGGFFNWGACYANSPGGNAACGDQVQQWFDCLDDVCTDCVTDAEFAACSDKAAADPKSCGGLSFSACGAALDSLNAACDTAAKAIGASCGP